MLVPPTLEEYEIFVHNEMPEEPEWAEQALIQSTDVMWVATGIEEYPTDPREARIVKNAIMELSRYLLASEEVADRTYNNFSSETIGSYTYSKAQRALVSIQSGIPLGLFWVDLAISMLSREADKTNPSIGYSGEQVFPPNYKVFNAPYARTDSLPDFYGW